MEVFKVHRGESDWILVAGEVFGDCTRFYVLRVSSKHSIAAKRDGLLYAYKLLTPGEARIVAEHLEKKSALSENNVCSIVNVLLSETGAVWGRRDMPVYRFGCTVVEVSPPRRSRRLLIKTDSPLVAEFLQQEFKARWLPRLKGWLIEANDWRSVVERVRVLAERASREKELN